MRAVLFILILVVVALLIAVATGFLDISQIRGATAPQISTTGNGVTAKGGQAPAFDVQTGSVSLGTQQKTVAVPALRVNPPAATNQQDENVTANATGNSS
jgi:hypothetical protein